jgi:hypothetical protein
MAVRCEEWRERGERSERGDEMCVHTLARLFRISGKSAGDELNGRPKERMENTSSE